MSPSRWAVSAFLLWHISGLAVLAIPSSDSLPEVKERASIRDDVAGRVLTPWLDRVASRLRPVAAAGADLSGPLRTPARWYVQRVGLAQHWRMFSNPPVSHQYVRLRFYVARVQATGNAGLPEWVASELITPAHRENRVRWVKSYRDSTTDKAVMVALEQFFRRRRPSPNGIPSGKLPDDLAPLVRYFGRRFASARLLSDERIVRAEFWYGTAPVPSMGGTDSAVPRPRLAALQAYYDGPIEYRGPIPNPLPYPAFEREADISWVLEYFENP